MRTFHSYGPVDCEEHFCVQRTELIDRCVKQLIGHPEKGGHYFTIWSPRQCGKTWLMRQVARRVEQMYPDQFEIGMMSMQGVLFSDDPKVDEFLPRIPRLLEDGLRISVPPPTEWEGFTEIFHRNHSPFDRPVILFIDEFDSLPPAVIDRLITLFRDMYLKRESYLLHGLALIGVRAVLGVESLRGSPFNIQRSLHVPRFTPAEVTDLFDQYQAESGQTIQPEVVQTVYDVTRGQPGLVGWLGELLTEKYNSDPERAIDAHDWKGVYAAALHTEWNNNLLNLITKAQGRYSGYVMELFTKADMPFSIRAEWCSYLYLNGIIDSQASEDASGNPVFICRFASPFVQSCLFEVFTASIAGEHFPILALDPLDTLADVFETEKINLPALLGRYKSYLKRLKAKGLNPWKDQPRRTDLHYTEAVGHFHLYAWLQNAVSRLCHISPEFPTGNGRVDLHLRCRDRVAVIEVKSFRDQAELQHSRKQAVQYARQLQLSGITLALFVPVQDEDVLAQLSGSQTLDGVRLEVVAIGWE